MKNKFISLWMVFLVYFFCYMAIEINLGVLLSIWSVALAIYLLVKNKLPSIKYIFIALVFAVLVSISYLGLNMGTTVVLTNVITSGLPTLLCSLAVFSVMKNSDDIKLVKKEKKLATLIIAISVGTVLSVINYFIMRENNIP